MLGCRELPALVRHRVVMSRVVGLREDGRYCRLAGVRREHRAPARIECAEDRSRCKATFQGVEALLFHWTPVPRGVRTTQARERGRDVGVALDKAAVVVAQPDELA